MINIFSINSLREIFPQLNLLTNVIYCLLSDIFLEQIAKSDKIK